MRSQQIVWNHRTSWMAAKTEIGEASLVLYFGTRQLLACGTRYQELRNMYPKALILGCSTGGQINNSDISDDEIVAAAISLDATPLRLYQQDISEPNQSRSCGEAIGRALYADDLAGVFVLSDGLNVNGSELVAGITKIIGPKITLTGGLAGDGADFKETLVGGNCAPRTRTILGIGFYGSAIRIGHGSAGGWTCSDRAGGLQGRPVMSCLSWMMSPRSTSTNATSDLRSQRRCQPPHCCSRSRFTT